MGRIPKSLVRKKRNPTRLTNVFPPKKLSAVPGGTCELRSPGSTSKFNITRSRHSAERKMHSAGAGSFIQFKLNCSRVRAAGHLQRRLPGEKSMTTNSCKLRPSHHEWYAQSGRNVAGGKMRATTMLARLGCAVFFLAACASAQVKKQDADLIAQDGVKIKVSYYSAGKPGPGVLLMHQCNR